MTSLINTWR